MPSDRYRVIVAMLDDPLNRAAVTRELLRRGKLKMMPPPVPVKGDRVKFGWIFPTLRHVMRHGLPSVYTPREIETVDSEATVFTDGDHWYITLTAEDNTEMGPFDSGAVALEEARRYLESEGFTLLPEVPWSLEDVKSYPS